jgi:hypothetical protein
MFKLNRKNLIMLAVVAAIVFALWSCNNKMGYEEAVQAEPAMAPKAPANGVSGANGGSYAPASLDGTNIDLNVGCAMNSGVGLASSLLPREMASQEDFGQFAPDDILKGQNFLSPRQQVGWPETIGGTLRNANQQVRADPPNEKKAYTWNNSTIVPDLMQRKICT